MKKATKLATLAVAIVVVMAAFVVAMDQGPLSAGSADTGDDKNPPQGEGPNDENPTDETPGDDEPSVTTITATKTATGFWEKRTIFSWDVDKYLYGDVCEMQIEPGECVELSYYIDVKRSVCFTEVFGVRGFITVTNTGDCPTEGLAITDSIQCWNGECFVDFTTFDVDVSAMPVLQPGECYAYPYEVVFECQHYDVEHRNIAEVTITNFDGEISGVDVCAEFEIPCEPECIVVDKTACLTDYFSIPAGFAAIPLSDFGPWYLGDDDCMEWEFCVEFLLENREAPRYNTYCISNQCSLALSDSGETIIAQAQLTIATGEDETTLCVEKTAAVTYWTEYIAYQLDPETVLLIGDVEFVPEEFDMEPQIIAMDCTANVHTLTVAGAILVVNTGCYPTEGLTIVDTIQMLRIDPEAQLAAFDGDCWVDIACVTVDTSCKPMLLPGEWYYYPYEVTFTIDDLELAGLASCMFRNQAYVEICNYDDDCEVDGVYDYAPLYLPLYPNMITVETTAVVESCDVVPFGECASLNIEAVFSYRQLIVVKNFEDRSTIDVCTEITLNGRVWADDCICEAERFNLAITNSQSKCAAGEYREISMGMEGFVDDCDSLSFCVFGEEVCVNIYSFLCYSEGQELILDDYFIFGEYKLGLGGVLIGFEVY